MKFFVDTATLPDVLRQIFLDDGATTGPTIL